MSAQPLRGFLSYKTQHRGKTRMRRQDGTRETVCAARASAASRFFGLKTRMRMARRDKENSLRRAFQLLRGSDCRKTSELSRGTQPFRTFNRAQRRVRWARDDFCAGKSHFPEQKSFPCSFCARKSLRFQQKLVRVVGRLKTLWVFRFRPWRNCRRLKSKI